LERRVIAIFNHNGLLGGDKTGLLFTINKLGRKFIRNDAPSQKQISKDRGRRDTVNRSEEFNLNDHVVGMRHFFNQFIRK